uniref:FAD dependent oxidoreductase domain-containing protein n=1 Tax=Glossina austeni TaxID=7395 RepID=A0A1A9VGL7_GLOAU
MCRHYITYHHLDALTQLSDSYDVVVNCSGFGAKDLCIDHHLVPIRGKVIKVRAPWIKMAFYGDMILKGGCRQFDTI